MRFLLCILPFFLFAVPAPKDRPPSTPYISGDTFRYYADFVYDELDTSLNPAKVPPKSTLFVKTDYLNRFFQDIHPHLPHPYILITHNSDDPAPGTFAHYLDDPKLLAWFGQNFDGAEHPKMHPIPIGLANAHWTHGKFEKLDKVKNRQLAKTHFAYMNITLQTFIEERKIAYETFAAAPFCYKRTDRTYEKFLEDVASSDFVVSPRGNGLDTHRLWESLYLGSIPIVKTSTLDPLYKDLPVLIIDDWSMATETFLKAKREEIRHSNPDLSPLYIYYWLNKIDSYKK